MSINTDHKKIEEILTRGVSEAIEVENLKKKLLSGRKLRVKLGIDPTSPNLHIGRSVQLLKLRDFQEMGHQVVFIVGDFTGVIGDTSDKESERPMLEKKKVTENMKNYIDQAGRIIDIEKCELRYNSEWLAKLTYGEIGEQADQFSVAEFIARENIKRRLDAGTRVSLREMLYPLMQGYDSVAMDVDLEVGGSDQLFNMMSGRDLMHKIKGKGKFVMATKLLVDKEGNKVGKTTGNALFLDSTPENFYGGIMSFPDETILLGFELLTEVPLDGLEEKIKAKPMEEKKHLAYEIVKLLWGEESAKKSQVTFENTFQKRDLPELSTQNISSILLEDALVELKLCTSKSEAKRLIQQGGVDVDEQKVFDPNFQLPSKKDIIIKAGKTKFVKIRVN